MWTFRPDNGPQVSIVKYRQKNLDGPAKCTSRPKSIVVRLRRSCRDYPVLRCLAPAFWCVAPPSLRSISLLMMIFQFCLPLELAQAASAPFYEVREVKPHVFVWVPEDILDQDADPQFRRAGTAGFIITAAAVVVINA